ncbi:MAG: FAD-dependent thymidylate synthase [Deltaproteobacteria bacterium]|nr:FAD-dependent thymidylate synthase [Deltaproteobacteria bacterium]
MNDLTLAEKEMLAPFVTNTEGPVFVLTNLPEVVKGALFSRYSRSSLGLRELLVKEFLGASEAELGDMLANASAGDLARKMFQAVSKAQSFYDRILDGYGDDSIGELGGAHLALEGVSMLATKAVEDARIGGSPLEKSTRYVSFADKANGEYRFYQEPRLMAAHGDLYLNTCRSLFEGYKDMIPQLTLHLQQRMPREEGVSEAAWLRSVKARALDGLRGLLPAATLTNMGVFGNGRFFETLLIRLGVSHLTELNHLARDAGRELNKVIPSLIRRADPGHRHFEGFQRFYTHYHAAVKDTATTALFPDREASSLPEGGVNLVDWDRDAETRLLASLVYPETDLPLDRLRAWAEGLTDEDKTALFKTLTDTRENRRHKLGRELEMVEYTFDLLGDFGMYRDMHRHRTLTQSRQRLTTRHGYVLPPEVVEAGLEERFRGLMAQAAHAWEVLSVEFPEEAQYVVPMAFRVRWLWKVNLRALCWLLELRSQPQGHPAYREMAQKMFRRIEQVHPRLASLLRFVDLHDYPLGRLGAEQRLEEKRQEKK